jgi:hypothetical protein
MINKKVKKIFAYVGSVMCSLAIILAVPLIVHPNVSGEVPASDNTATVVSFSNGNPNSMNPKETCTIMFRLDGDLIPITETPEYCESIKVGDKVKI